MSTDRETLLRISALERKVSDLYKQLGQEEPAPEDLVSASVDDQLILLVQQGDTMEAIKRYRSLTGGDLAEAKQAVEHLAGQYKPTG